MPGPIFFSDDEQGLKELGLSNPQRSAFGELMTAEKTFGAGWNFFTDLNPISVIQNIAGSGVISQASAQATVATGTTASSTAEIVTARSVDYLNGTGVEAIFTALFAVGSAGHIAEIGLSDSLNGWLFQEKEGTFGIVRRQNGVDDFIPQSSWNTDNMDGDGDEDNPSGQLLDITKGNVFKIEFQWLGYGVQNFYIEDSATGLFQLVHRIAYANTATTPSVFVPNLPMRAFVDNGGTTDNVQLKTASSGVYSQGKPRETGPRFGVFTDVAIAAGEKGLIQIRNKSTFAGNPNYSRIRVDVSGVSLDSGQPAIFFIRTGSSVAGVSYSDVDTTNSRVEVSYSNGAVSGGRILYPVPISSRGADNSERPAVFINPGETLELTCDPGNNSPIVAGISWEELA